jgi:hypothetical protein
MHCRALPPFPLSLLPLLALLAACQPPPPREALDADTLQVQARQLAAVAAEADLVTRELGAGHLNRSYAWVHQQSLGEQAGKAASELARPAPPALQAVQHRALETAGQLRLVVARIAAAQDDPAALQALRHELSGVQAQVRQLAPSAAP